MLECRDQIEHHIYWQPRMGSALFWFENWIELGALYFVTPPEFFCDKSVQNIYDVVQDGVCDEDKLKTILPEELAVHIIEHIPPPVVHEELDSPF